MRPRVTSRPAPIAVAVCGLALVALSAVVDPGARRHAGAQTVPVGTVEVTDPAVAGLAPATPAPPEAPGNAAEIAAPEVGGSLTASLGGSDVAVSSVGGSYEIDGPKRKAKKWPRPVPTP